MNNRAEVESRFIGDIKNHVLTVIKDDGLHRHLHFSKPGTMCMHFDIITWPGYLAYAGDMGCYLFSRIDDMLQFFRGDKINPQYWAEKVKAEDRDRVKKFSPEAAEQWVKERLDETEASDEVREAAKFICFHDGEYDFLSGLRDFEYDTFIEYYDHDFREYTFHYLWCCHALVWGIKQYDALTKTIKETP